MYTNSELYGIFSAIKAFITDASECFGEEQKGLGLYKTLIDKTLFSKKEIVKKHIEIFNLFLKSNLKVLKSQNVEEFNPESLEYSKNVSFNVKNLIKSSPDPTPIWNHLIFIYKLIDPSVDLEETNILCTLSEGEEKNVIEDMFSQITSSLGDVKDPMTAINNIVGSGMLNSLANTIGEKVSNGDVDVNKLMGMVTGMLNTAGGDTNEVQNIIGTVLGNMKLD